MIADDEWLTGTIASVKCLVVYCSVYRFCTPVNVYIVLRVGILSTSCELLAADSDGRVTENKL